LAGDQGENLLILSRIMAIIDYKRSTIDHSGREDPEAKVTTLGGGGRANMNWSATDRPEGRIKYYGQKSITVAVLSYNIAMKLHCRLDTLDPTPLKIPQK
jgi:hypothetical protein